MTTDSGDVGLRLALEGGGIVRLADVIVAEPIRRGLLVPLLIDVHDVERLPLAAMYLAGRHRLPKLRVFLDFLVERFGSAPWRIDAKELAAAQKRRGTPRPVSAASDGRRRATPDRSRHRAVMAPRARRVPSPSGSACGRRSRWAGRGRGGSPARARRGFAFSRRGSGVGAAASRACV